MTTRPAPQSPAPSHGTSSQHSYDVRAFGAIGDGRSLDTDAINRAIRAADCAGGGTVWFPPGEYLSYSVRLRSRVWLKLSAGAVLIAAAPPAPGSPGGYDEPEPGGPNEYQDFGHSRFRNSLIWGEGLQDVGIEGPGRIYGRGLSRGNGRVAAAMGTVAAQPAGHLPDVLEADGDFPAHPLPDGWAPGRFGYPHGRDHLPPGVGNKSIALRDCRNVTVRDLTILHGGHFAVLAAGCDHLLLENLLIDTNRDGIDVDGCSNVRISRCSVNSPWDDGICVKSSCGFGRLKPAENITISDCYVSGFVEGSLYEGTRRREIQHRGGPIGRIKLGTEASGGFRNIAVTNCIFEFCRGLALEQVDGSVMEDIVISNLVMRDVMNAPIFVRLGARLRAPEAKQPGSAQRISINNVVAYGVAPEHGIFIAGLPSHPVRDIRLTSVQLHSQGGGLASDRQVDVPEMPTAYPEPMLFGRLPSWGLYARHVEGLDVSDVSLLLATGDARPAVILEDAIDCRVARVRLPRGAKKHDWVVRNSSLVTLRDCDGAD